MSITLTKVPDSYDAWGKHLVTGYDVALDTSYPAGGYSITPANVGLSRIDEVIIGNGNIASAAFRLAWDYANKKLVAASASGGAPTYLSLPYLKGATTGSSENADANGEPVNGTLIVTDVTFTVAAGALTIAQNPDVSRNVTIVIENTTGGALNLFVGATTFTVTGTFRGAAQTEAITFTSTGGNKVIAAGKWRFKAGAKPFDTVTSITYDNAADGALTISVAPGTLVGLPSSTLTGAIADILIFNLSGAPRTISGNFDFTNWTANTGTIADAATLQILYKTAGGQIATATDLSAVTARCLFIGG